MSSWVIVLFQSSIASPNFSRLPLSTIFILTLKICFLWKMYSSSLCFFCFLSHYFWIEYFLVFIFMVFNGSLAIELTLVQHRFQLCGSTYMWSIFNKYTVFFSLSESSEFTDSSNCRLCSVFIVCYWLNPQMQNLGIRTADYGT